LQNLELLKLLTEDAEALNAWDWLLPLLEATQLHTVQENTPQELAVAAALYQSKLEDHDRAFSLYSLAFVLAPDAGELARQLEELAGRTGRFDLLADTLRIGAAASGDHQVTIELLRRIAVIYEEKLGASGRAIDVHRRQLALKEDELRARLFDNARRFLGRSYPALRAPEAP
jgi:tetratricopeptide (TPR) repeat protein